MNRAMQKDSRIEKIGVIIILAGVAIRIPFLFLPLTYGSDVWRQADTASIARHFFINGYNILHPQIYWGGTGPGYVESEFQLYPFIVAILYKVFGEHLLLGRLVSLLFSIGTLKVFHSMARRVIGESGALWGLGFLTIAPIFIRYSVAFTPESTMMFFYVVSISAFIQWLDDDSNLSLVVAAISASLAVLVKGTPIQLGVLFILLVFFRKRWSVFRRWDLWVAAIVGLLPPALWFLYARKLYLTYGNTFGILSGGDSKLGGLKYWLDPHFYVKTASLDVVWICAGAGAVGFALGLAWALKTGKYHLLMAGMITLFLYYLAVARYAQEGWGIQYHIFAVPFAALGIGMGMDWLDLRFHNRKSMVFAWMIAVATLVGSSVLYFRMMSDEGNAKGRMLIHCAEAVKRMVPEGTRIVVSTTELALENGVPNNYEEPNIFFYSDRYGWSLPADRHDPDLLEKYRKMGAGYFVIYSRELLEANPRLAHYLETQCTQVGPGIEAGCGIYLLGKKVEMQAPV